MALNVSHHCSCCVSVSVCLLRLAIAGAPDHSSEAKKVLSCMPMIAAPSIPVLCGVPLPMEDTLHMEMFILFAPVVLVLFVKLTQTLLLLRLLLPSVNADVCIWQRSVSALAAVDCSCCLSDGVHLMVLL